MDNETEHWVEGTRVIVDFEGTGFCSGKIKKVFKRRKQAKILFDDGDIHTISLSDIILEPTDDEDEFDAGGFNQYAVVWDKSKINFKLQVDDVHFYGWWRKLAPKRYAIDLYARHHDGDCNVETLDYSVNDPREELKSLEADICAAANKWFYHLVNGNMDTITELRLKATKPTIHIRRLHTLDRMLLSLREFRNTTIRLGGTRCFVIESDTEGDPSMRIEVDITPEAQAYEGKPPPLLVGATRNTGEDGDLDLTMTELSDLTGIQSLVAQLEKSQDPSEQRKIRAVLRKQGFRGGIKKIKKLLEQKNENPPTKKDQPITKASKTKHKVRRKRLK